MKTKHCDLSFRPAARIEDASYKVAGAVFRRQLGPEYVQVTAKDGKGGDPKHWPKELRVRQFPKMAGVQS